MLTSTLSVVIHECYNYDSNNNSIIGNANVFSCQLNLLGLRITLGVASPS